jgi:hypothetical protein
MSKKDKEVTINPCNGLVMVDGKPLTAEQHKVLWGKMNEEITNEIDKELIAKIKKAAKEKEDE